MTDVFISYSREDAAQAQQLAKALQAAGYSCWWDRELVSGARYLVETETQLKTAKAVVVIWSRTSIVSHWVADEAGAGRDDNRLAALTFDGSMPPLGFRQFQVTDFAGWRGGTDESAFQSLLRGLERLVAPHSSPTPAVMQSVPKRRWYLAVAATLGVLAVAVALWFIFRQSPATAVAVTDKSVAVLAFANLSDESDNEYFSEGISEELINVLARVPDLKVTARTSAFAFKGKEMPIPEIARQLGVAYIVEGSVRRSGDTVRITAQLIKAADGFQIWSGTFTRELKDIFAVQDEIAGLVAGNISPQLMQVAAGATRQVDPEAFRLYLEGRALATRAGVGNLQQAIALFDRALARDPGFSLVRSQQARAYIQLGRWGGMVPREAWAAARAALAPALTTDPDVPEVQVAQGWLLRTSDWKWLEAERAFERALVQRPSDTDVIVSTAVLKTGIGRSAEAISLAERALELDPLNPATQFDLGLIYRFSGRLADAESRFRRALELSPDGQRYRGFLGLALVKLGTFDEAEQMAREEPDLLTRLFVQGLVAEGRGNQPRLREIIAEIRSKRAILENLGDYPAYSGALLVAAGEFDAAMTQVESLRDTRDPGVGWMKVNYHFSRLHGHPRWPAFLRSVGLSDEQLAERLD